MRQRHERRYPTALRALAIACLLALPGVVVGGAAARAADPPVTPPSAPPAGNLTASDIAAAKAAIAALDGNDFAAARTALDGIKDKALHRVVLWRMAVQRDAGLSFADYRALIPTVADWPNLALLEVRAEQSIGAADPPAAIAAWFETRPPRTVEGWTAYVAALRTLGRKDAADDAARQAWTKLQMSTAEESAFRTANKAAIGAAEDLDRLHFLLRTGRWRAAQRLLAQATVPPADKAVIDVRIAMQKRAKGSEAAIERALTALTAKQRQDPDLMFDEVRWLRRSDRSAIAARRLIGAPVAMASPGRWRVERSIVVRDLAEAKQTQLAYEAAAKHTHTDALGIATFEFLAGWIALRLQGLPGRALPHFEKLYAVSDSTISKSRGAYWAGRAAQRLGNGRLARQWWQKAAAYPYTFYGQRAAARLGTSRLTLPRDLAADAAAKRAFDAEDQVAAVRLLHLAGDRDGARVLLWQLATRAEAPMRFRLIADLAQAVERPEMRVRAGRNGLRDGVALVGPGFPMPAPPKEIEVDAALVLAIIRQESEFYPEAVSRAGARGLMQLLPGTARSVARDVKLPYDRGRLTSDPAYNMRLGARYLHRLLVRFRGSLILAIAAYNAGPRRADDWLRRFGDPRSRGIDPIDWMEWVPFGETRNYIQRVLENYAVYKALKGDAALPRWPRTYWTSQRHVNCANTRRC